MMFETRISRPRHELKYEISSAEAVVLSERLGMLFPHDEHAGRSGSYTVSSLYFDTPHDDALRQKHEGLSLREKWRIRTYKTQETPKCSPVFYLEKKFKRRELGTKSKVQISRDEARAFATSRLDQISPERIDKSEVLAEFAVAIRTQLLRPVVMIAYEREAFSFAPGNVRITLDAHMRSSSQVQSFFETSPVLIPFEPGVVVLEVKYDAFLPDIVRDAIQVSNTRQTAHSKYALGRRFE